jgi:hypothetical protein
MFGRPSFSFPTSFREADVSAFRRTPSALLLSETLVFQKDVDIFLKRKTSISFWTSASFRKRRRRKAPRTPEIYKEDREEEDHPTLRLSEKNSFISPETSKLRGRPYSLQRQNNKNYELFKPSTCANIQTI